MLVLPYTDQRLNQKARRKADRVTLLAMADTYEPPRIEQRAEIENPLIGTSSNVCAAFNNS